MFHELILILILLNIVACLIYFFPAQILSLKKVDSSQRKAVSNFINISFYSAIKCCVNVKH